MLVTDGDSGIYVHERMLVTYGESRVYALEHMLVTDCDNKVYVPECMLVADGGIGVYVFECMLVTDGDSRVYVLECMLITYGDSGVYVLEYMLVTDSDSGVYVLECMSITYGDRGVMYFSTCWLQMATVEFTYLSACWLHMVTAQCTYLSACWLQMVTVVCTYLSACWLHIVTAGKGRLTLCSTSTLIDLGWLRYFFQLSTLIQVNPPTARATNTTHTSLWKWSGIISFIHGFGLWICNYNDIKLWEVITRLYHNFNGRLVKQSLKVIAYGYIIATHGFCIRNYSCLILTSRLAIFYKKGPDLGFLMRQSLAGLNLNLDDILLFIKVQVLHYNERDGVSNHGHLDCLLNRADQRTHQSSASLAFVRGIYRWPMHSPHKGPVTRKMFSFHDVIMKPLINVGPVWASSVRCRYLSKSGRHIIVFFKMAELIKPLDMNEFQYQSEKHYRTESVEFSLIFEYLPHAVSIVE